MNLPAWKNETLLSCEMRVSYTTGKRKSVTCIEEVKIISIMALGRECVEGILS